MLHTYQVLITAVYTTDGTSFITLNLLSSQVSKIIACVRVVRVNILCLSEVPWIRLRSIMGGPGPSTAAVCAD